MVGRPRVLHVLATPRAEGTPNLVLDWLTARPDWWQGVAVLHAHPADLTDRLRAAAAAYTESDLFDRGWRKFPLIARFVARAVADHRPDVLVCWTTGFANWVCAGARWSGCTRLLVHAGNPAGHDRYNRWMTRYVVWPLAVLRAKVVCCSDYVRTSYATVPGVSRHLFHTIYNCSRAGAVAARAEAARTAAPAGRPPTAVMVATLESHKDHPTLIRAVPAIAKAVPGFRLRLVGSGSRLDELRQLVHTVGVGEAVEFLGTRADVPELLGGADVFVFATTPQEGLGSVLLEALAAGLPVVANDVPACRELLAGGRWGVLVAPSDPDRLAEAVVAAFAGGRSDAAAVRYATGFTPERMTVEYLRVAGTAGGVSC